MNSRILNLAMIFALSTSAVAWSAPAVTPAVAATTVTDADRAEFRAAIADNPMFALLMKEFPERYGPFETQLLADAKAGKVTGIQARDRTFAFVTEIQTELSPFSVNAPAADLKALALDHVVAMKALEKVNLRACAALGEGSGLTPEMSGSLPPAALAALTAYSAHEMRVGIAGKKHGLKHPAPTDADIEILAKHYEAAGGDFAYLSAMGDETINQIPPSDRCRNIILWVEAIAAQDPALVARILGGAE